MEDALCDRVVCGIRSEIIQRKFLSEVKLTFTNACQLALAMKSAERQAKSLSVGENGNENLHQVYKYVKKGPNAKYKSKVTSKPSADEQ